ncbi:MAG: hypothetical protein GXP27_17500 [Planctomycetes bacterium]|nr:hypothetical protein [Planctomycetota bacterium]
MQRVVWSLLALLVILHHDLWFWHDTGLVFGIVPVGLAHHVGISIAAGCVWWLATRYCWPTDLEVVEAEGPSDASSSLSSWDGGGSA